MARAAEREQDIDEHDDERRRREREDLQHEYESAQAAGERGEHEGLPADGLDEAVDALAHRLGGEPRAVDERWVACHARLPLGALRLEDWRAVCRRPRAIRQQLCMRASAHDKEGGGRAPRDCSPTRCLTLRHARLIATFC